MKASELMIGDFVRQKYSNLLLRVSVVNSPYIQADGEGGEFKEDTIEPILLTPEILKKNNAHKELLMGEQRHFTYSIDDLKLLAIYDADFSFQINGGASKIKYVHELQHVLRLCGIYKEIVL